MIRPTESQEIRISSQTALFEQCVANHVTILRPLASTEWRTKDFYVEDPDGYIICFGGAAAT